MSLDQTSIQTPRSAGHPHTHAHSHGGTHPHAHAAEAASARWMVVSIAATLAFVIGEGVAASRAHSLALASDAGHNLADAAALGLSWYALWIARRPSTRAMTFGYHRVGILAALVNALMLVLIAVGVAWEAFQRLRAPGPVNGWLMVGVASAAVALNATLTIGLHSGAKRDLNLRGAYLHLLGDAVSAMGVVVAGVVAVLWGASWADPAVSFVIAGLILFGSWGILRASVFVLLEGAPLGVDMAGVEAAIAGVPGVIGVHDLHVWTVGAGAIACSCHVRVAEQSVREGQLVICRIVEQLDHDFGINHSTVQIEVDGHDASPTRCTGQMYCTIDRAAVPHEHHHHD